LYAFVFASAVSEESCDDVSIAAVAAMVSILPVFIGFPLGEAGDADRGEEGEGFPRGPASRLRRGQQRRWLEAARARRSREFEEDDRGASN
jgi:hypothetical protein